MKLDKYAKLKNELEIFSFEKNFNPLNKTLYYFSFLGNIFLILFSYFFIKDITNSIPVLFFGQDLFFSIFIVLFMTGYELFKRFTFEQLTTSIVKNSKININIILGVIISIILAAGSFYLSLNGAHRLIDTTYQVETQLDTIQNKNTELINGTYQSRIKLKENQIQAINDNDEDGVLSLRQRKIIKDLEKDITQLETDRDTRIKQTEIKSENKLSKEENKIQENSFAFAIMVFFLEIVILIGVSFNSFYVWNSYVEMKNLMNIPKYKQLETNINLLKLYYQNGRKKESDPVIPANNLKILVNNSKLKYTQKDIINFLAICSELDITVGLKRDKVYNMSFEKAKHLLENQEI
jgi:hypothetical protein